MDTVDIPGYEGYYKITPDGSVHSVRKNRWLKPGFRNRISRNGKKGNTVKQVHLSVKPEGMKCYNIGRLVALSFIPNPNNYPQINHIDGDSSNNTIENIEWCTQSQNIKHAYDNELMTPNRGRRKNSKREQNIHLTKNNKYTVAVTHKYKVYSLGTYENIGDAVKARDNFINSL